MKGCYSITLTVFTIWQPLLQEERIITKQFTTVGAGEAFRMVVLADGVQTILEERELD